MAFINKHDTNGTKGLLAKGELGYDDYSAGGDTGRVYVGTGTENIALAERLESNMMTKAQFNALAEERKANRAGSGFEINNINNYTNIYWMNVQNGIKASTGVPGSASNQFVIGGIGAESDIAEEVVINGVNQNISYVATTTKRLFITLPTAPNIYPHDTALTPEQIASGVIKHADASNSGLIVNGKFDVDTSGWTSTTAILSVVSNTLKVQNSNGYGSANNLGLPLGSSFVAGKAYVIEFDLVEIFGGNQANTLVLPNGANFPTNGIGRYSATFTANGTTMLSFVVGGNIIGDYKRFGNIAVYPADAISRTDLVFLESWHEDISEKNFVYPLGNVQYLGGNVDGLTGIANGSFSEFETYSLFGNWQTPSSLIGKGYVWSSLSEAQKRAFISNPENNCYLDGDKTIQVRYRIRVVQGWGDSWANVSTQINHAPTNGAITYATYTNGAVIAKGKKAYSSEVGSYSTSSVYWASANTTKLGFDSGIAYSFRSSSPLDTTISYNGTSLFLPITLVHRRNQGMYHNTYNPNGTRVASDGLDCFTTTISFNSISDCFDQAKLLTVSGYIGTVSGRPDGLFYDQVHESCIQDLRNNSKKVEDFNRLISREFNKLVAGSTRGKEEEWQIESMIASVSQFTDLIQIKNNVGFKLYDYIVLHDSGNNNVYRGYITNIGTSVVTVNFTYTRTAGNTYTYTKRTSRTKSNTLLHCDIIGNPTNYPSTWKESGVFGTPLIVAEDGTSLLPDGAKDTFKLSRKANAAPLLCLRSTDSGVTWTSFAPTFSTTTNAITLTDEPAANLVMVYYRTHTSMAVPTVNSEVLEVGDVYAGNSFRNLEYLGASFMNTLIGKTSTNSSHPVASSKSLSAGLKGYQSTLTPLNSYVNEYAPRHEPIQLFGSDSPTAKVFPYLTRKNGKAYLNLVFKEMKHNGTSWGDDSKFNIVDNVSTTLDDNAQTVLIGQKTVELPYFIGADE